MPPSGKRVFASIVELLFTFAQSQGVDREELHAIAQLGDEELADPDALVDYESLIRIWSVLIERFPERPLGLTYSSLVDIEALGVVGFAMRHAENGHQALDFYRRFSKLADPCLTIDLLRDGPLYRLVLTHEARVEAMVEPIEMMVLGSVRIASSLVRGDARIREICFRHRARHDAALYAESVGAPVRFEASYHGAAFEPGALDTPFEHRNPRIISYLSQHAEALLHEAEAEQATIEDRVLDKVRQRLISGEVGASEIARALGTSVRTLQRELRGRGTSLKELVETARRERAELLLKSPVITVAEVAFAIGYSDPRVFYRSFRRWTGLTPTAYRASVAPPSTR